MVWTLTKSGHFRTNYLTCLVSEFPLNWYVKILGRSPFPPVPLVPTVLLIIEDKRSRIALHISGHWIVYYNSYVSKAEASIRFMVFAQKTIHHFKKNQNKNTPHSRRQFLITLMSHTWLNHKRIYFIFFKLIRYWQHSQNEKICQIFKEFLATLKDNWFFTRYLLRYI